MHLHKYLCDCLTRAAAHGNVVAMEASRRMGAQDSQTRTKLLDAAEQLMLEEGYAAVTSRRVGHTAGISSQLVHYYFRTMDDLFLDVFRRRAEEGFARFERAIEAQPSLRTIWSSLSDGSGSGSVFNLEFAALANHRKAIRAEIATYAERFRSDAARGDLVDPRSTRNAAGGITPEVVLVVMAGVSQLIALERALGVSGGHDRRSRSSSSTSTAQVFRERGRPRVEVGRHGVAGLVVDRRPVLGDVLDRRPRPGVHVALGRRDEDPREATGAGRVDLAADRAVLVGEERDHRRDELRCHLRVAVAGGRAGHARDTPRARWR